MVKTPSINRIALLISACALSTLCSISGLNDVSAADQKVAPTKSRAAANAKPSRAKHNKKPKQNTLDKTLERNVLQMVNNHLPDIRILLDQLREKEPRQYDLAIRNLAKSSRRLQAAKNRSEESFELEVHVIQAQSAINLLIAKLKIRDRKSDRKALLEATKQFQTAELARYEHELALQQSRLAKMKEQVATGEKRISDKRSKMDEIIEKSFKSYLRKSGRKE